MEKKERSCTVGENVIDTTTVEDSMEISLKTRNKTTIRPMPLLGIHPEETKIEKDTCIP